MEQELFTKIVALTAAVGISLTTAAPAHAGQDIDLAALPAVNMEAVLKAAQIDPRRADSAITPGSEASVLAVERALDAKNFLAAQYVDGHFGTSTINAYAAYQRSLGYTGIDASGLPGPTSLKQLGDQRYTVDHVVSAGSRVTLLLPSADHLGTGCRVPVAFAVMMSRTAQRTSVQGRRLDRGPLM